MTPLSDIRKRAEAATPGPWRASGTTIWHPTGDGTPTDFTGVAVAYVPPIDEDPQADQPDADFIAHARTDTPALLEALDEATAERDALRAGLEAAENDKRGLVHVEGGKYQMAGWVHEMWPEWASEWEAKINEERAARALLRPSEPVE